jgi:hypothetical protein
MTKSAPQKEVNDAEATAGPLTCGLIMPISSIDGCPAEHWADVKAIVTEAVEGIINAKFKVKLVSDADDIGVIQKRIVQNVYHSDIIVCDVSGKNPNVMFELGLRLAFDKPTVIIKDDKTDYSFDTGIIEHVAYPRDLRFNRMVKFKSELASKVVATFNAAKADPNHSTFLKNFGKFHVASLSEDAVPADKLVVEMLSEIQSEISRLRISVAREARGDVILRQRDGEALIKRAISKYLAENPNVKLVDLVENRALAYKIPEAFNFNPGIYYQTVEEYFAAVDNVLNDAIIGRVDLKQL